MALRRPPLQRPGHPPHRWPLLVLVAALLMLVACDPKKSTPPKPETGVPTVSVAA